MEIVLRVALGVVLAGAALAKLASPRASIAALGSFGFEEGPLRPIAWAVLIAVELALAVGVALGSDAAAYAAAALMALFAALTVAALLRGRAGTPCACFGPRSKVSWLGVARNLALAVAFALVPSADSISIGTQGWMWIAIGVALAACAGLAVAVLGLAREVGMLRLQLGTQGALEITGEGPDIGSIAPGLSARISQNGADFGLAVFTSEGCGICQTLAPAIENVAQDPRVAVGVFDEVAEAELWRSLEIPGSPFALALDREGTVLAKGTFNNLAQLESVLATAERRGEPRGA
ncbi:MAG TPA: MauE/DoxX family redox-associated membrane protein [Solirubrobacterales bacterium]|nr:MauE/DoxX family redox-associated membrane protein [Solirubrobacterales bacterium]